MRGIGVLGGAVLLVLAGCDRDRLWDRDGDGEWTWDHEDGVDCDDTDASINTGATEVCNGVDDNCDGVTDDDAVDARWWYPDDDGDGFGDRHATQGQWLWKCEDPGEGWVDTHTDCDDLDPIITDKESEFFPDRDGDDSPVDGESVIACAAPEGFAARGDAWDCNDEDPAIHPEAPEECNGIDDDCDDLVDVDDPSLAGTGRWYLDFDGDGYGRDMDYVLACKPQEGRTTTPGDCDDSASGAAIHPGAAEVPYDGQDNDCVDGDACDLDGDGFDYVDCAGGTDCIDDPEWSEGALRASDVRPGVEETWYDGVDENCDGRDDYDRDGDGYRCDPSVAPGCKGKPFVCADDRDVDGCDCNDNPDDGGADFNPDQWEVLTSDAFDEDCDDYINEVVIDDSWHLGGTYAASGSGLGTSGDAGAAILALGDTDGDGHDDYLIGAPTAYSTRGTVALVSGADAATSTGRTASSRYWVGPSSGTKIGASLDFYRNGSGTLTHYLVGGRGAVWLAPTTAAVSRVTPRLVPPSPCTTRTLPMVGVSLGNGVYATSAPDCHYVSTWDSVPATGSTFAMAGSASRLNLGGYHQLGRAMVAGDLDNDGADDLVITTEEDETVAFIMLASEVDFTKGTWFSADPAGQGVTVSDRRCDAHPSNPRSVAVLDFDGDSVDDLVIGCPGFDDSSYRSGAVYIYKGSSSLTSGSSPRPDFIYYGVGGSFGASVASAGDVDPTVGGEELLVLDADSDEAYLLSKDAASGSTVDLVALPFTVSAGDVRNAVGVGDANAADSVDMAFAVSSGTTSEVHLLTWGP